MVSACMRVCWLLFIRFRMSTLLYGWMLRVFFLVFVYSSVIRKREEEKFCFLRLQMDFPNQDTLTGFIFIVFFCFIAFWGVISLCWFTHYRGVYKCHNQITLGALQNGPTTKFITQYDAQVFCECLFVVVSFCLLYCNGSMYAVIWCHYHCAQLHDLSSQCTIYISTRISVIKSTQVSHKWYVCVLLFFWRPVQNEYKSELLMLLLTAFIQ